MSAAAPHSIPAPTRTDPSTPASIPPSFLETPDAGPRTPALEAGERGRGAGADAESRPRRLWRPSTQPWPTARPAPAPPPAPASSLLPPAAATRLPTRLPTLAACRRGSRPEPASGHRASSESGQRTTPQPVGTLRPRARPTASGWEGATFPPALGGVGTAAEQLGKLLQADCGDAGAGEEDAGEQCQPRLPPSLRAPLARPW